MWSWFGSSGPQWNLLLCRQNGQHWPERSALPSGASCWSWLGAAWKAASGLLLPLGVKCLLSGHVCWEDSKAIFKCIYLFKVVLNKPCSARAKWQNKSLPYPVIMEAEHSRAETSVSFFAFTECETNISYCRAYYN